MHMTGKSVVFYFIQDNPGCNPYELPVAHDTIGNHNTQEDAPMLVEQSHYESPSGKVDLFVQCTRNSV